MAKQVINLGNSINDGTGDVLRVGAEKINANFTELYNLLGGSNGGIIEVVSRISGSDGLTVSSPSGEISLTLETASATQKGAVKIGQGISVDNAGTISVAPYTLPRAATNILGGIKVGNNLSIDNEGVLSADVQNYTLPTASPTTKGGIKIGTGLEVVNDFLNVTVSGVASALQDGPATLTYSAIEGLTQSTLQSNFGISIFSNENNFSSLGWTNDTSIVNQIVSSENGTSILHQNFAGGTSTQWTFRPDGILVGPYVAIGTIEGELGEQIISLLDNHSMYLGNSDLSSFIRVAGTDTSFSSQAGGGIEISATVNEQFSSITVGGINFSTQSFPPTGTPVETLEVNTEITGGTIFYGDVVISAGSKLGIRNSIVFQDGTVQTTAYQGVSPAEITVDRLVNGENEVILDGSGVLNIVNKIYSSSNTILESITDTSITAGTDLRLFANGVFSLRNYSTTSGISIVTALGEVNQKTWVFGVDGSVTFPDSTVQSSASISIADLKNIVASSTTFEDFKAAIALL